MILRFLKVQINLFYSLEIEFKNKFFYYKIYEAITFKV